MKRINMYLEEEDRAIVRYLRSRLGLDTDSAVIRFLIRKAAKEEGYVPGTPRPHRQDRPTR